MRTKVILLSLFKCIIFSSDQVCQSTIKKDALNTLKEKKKRDKKLTVSKPAWGKSKDELRE